MARWEVIRTEKSEKAALEKVLAELKEIGMGEFLVDIDAKGNERKGMKYRAVLLRLHDHKLDKFKSHWFGSLVDALRWAREWGPKFRTRIVVPKEDAKR